jgi:hypothetical protein
MKDNGQLIYIGLAILFSIFNAWNKKRKKAAAGNSTPKPKSVFDSFFQDENEIDDPIQSQMAYEGLSSEEYAMDEESEVETKVETTSTFEDIVNQRKNENNSVFTSSQKVETTQKYKIHPLLGSIRSPQEVRKAVVYAEILKTKF